MTDAMHPIVDFVRHELHFPLRPRQAAAGPTARSTRADRAPAPPWPSREAARAVTLAKLLVAIGATTSGLHRGLNAAGKSVDRLEGRFSRLRGGMGRATGSLVALGKKAVFVGALLATVLVGALGFATNAAIQYEDAFAGVRKTVEATEPELQQLSDDIREMARHIPIAATELARLGETAGALGVPTGNIKEFIRVTALLGATTNVTSDAAADALGRLTNILGLTTDDYSRFGSAVVGLGNIGQSTEAEILEISKRMGSAGKIAGLTTPQILGWASAVASVAGMEPERAGTSLQKFLLDVTKIASKASPKLTLLSKTAGLTGKAFSQLFDRDANAALLKFVEGLGKLSKSQKLATLEALGFTESGIQRMLIGVSSSYAEVNRQVALGTTFWGENVAMTEEAEKRFATTKNQLAILKQNLFDMAITLGDALLPLLVPLIIGLTTWIQNNQTLIKQIATDLVAGIQTVVGWVVTWIRENEPLIRQVGTFLVEAFRNVWTVLTTQVGPALFGEAGIIPAMVELGRQIFEWVVPKLQALATTLFGPGGVAESVMGVAGPILDNLIPALAGIGNSIFGGEGKRGLLPALGDLISTMWGGGKGPLAIALTNAGWLLNNVVAPAIQAVIDLFRIAIDTIREYVQAWEDFRADNVDPSFSQPFRLGPFDITPPWEGRAMGGYAPREPYLVGEKGPEIVDPNRGPHGYVYPDAGEWARDQMGGGGGNTYNVTVNNPSARTAEGDIAFTLRRLEALGS